MGRQAEPTWTPLAPPRLQSRAAASRCQSSQSGGPTGDHGWRPTWRRMPGDAAGLPGACATASPGGPAPLPGLRARGAGGGAGAARSKHCTCSKACAEHRAALTGWSGRQSKGLPCLSPRPPTTPPTMAPTGAEEVPAGSATGGGVAGTTAGVGSAGDAGAGAGGLQRRRQRSGRLQTAWARHWRGSGQRQEERVSRLVQLPPALTPGPGTQFFRPCTASKAMPQNPRRPAGAGAGSHKNVVHQ